jgi:hypothetical protein
VKPEYPMRQKEFAPALSPSELMTMEIVAEYQGIDTDTGIWKYFCTHWRSWFSNLRSRSNFARQGANPWQYKEILHKRLAQQMGAFDDNIHLVDGIPIPLCSFSRALQCRSFNTMNEKLYGICWLPLGV